MWRLKSKFPSYTTAPLQGYSSPTAPSKMAHMHMSNEALFCTPGFKKKKHKADSTIFKCPTTQVSGGMGRYQIFFFSSFLKPLTKKETGEILTL